jgi:hypothetical protein
MCRCRLPCRFGRRCSFDLPFDAVEIRNGPWSAANAQALSLWQAQLVAVRRLVALSGTDFHRLPPGAVRVPVAIRFWVTERSVAALLEAVGRGRAIVIGGVDALRVQFTIDAASIGDTVHTKNTQVHLAVELVAATHCLLRLISDRGVEFDRDLEGDAAFEQSLPANRSFYRLEIWSDGVDRHPLVVTNLIFLQR